MKKRSVVLLVLLVVLVVSSVGVSAELFGGRGGSISTLECPEGYFLSGFKATASVGIKTLQPICRNVEGNSIELDKVGRDETQQGGSILKIECKNKKEFVGTIAFTDGLISATQRAITGIQIQCHNKDGFTGEFHNLGSGNPAAPRSGSNVGFLQCGNNFLSGIKVMASDNIYAIDTGPICRDISGATTGGGTSGSSAGGSSSSADLGKDCMDDSACGDGLECIGNYHNRRDNSGSETKWLEPTPGVCGKKLAEFQECKLNSDCQEGLVCMGTHYIKKEGKQYFNIAGGICGEPLPEGSTNCYEDPQCEGDLVCGSNFINGEKFSGICGECFYDSQCGEGKFCIGRTSNYYKDSDTGEWLHTQEKPGFCSDTQGSVGDVCFFTSNCNEELTCVGERRWDTKTADDVHTDAQLGVCGEKLSDLATCYHDWQCKTGVCSGEMSYDSAGKAVKGSCVTDEGYLQRVECPGGTPAIGFAGEFDPHLRNFRLLCAGGIESDQVGGDENIFNIDTSVPESTGTELGDAVRDAIKIGLEHAIEHEQQFSFTCPTGNTLTGFFISRDKELNVILSIEPICSDTGLSVEEFKSKSFPSSFRGESKNYKCDIGAISRLDVEAGSYINDIFPLDDSHCTLHDFVVTQEQLDEPAPVPVDTIIGGQDFSTGPSFRYRETTKKIPKSVPGCDNPLRCKEIDEAWHVKLGMLLRGSDYIWDTVTNTWRPFDDVHFDIVVERVKESVPYTGGGAQLSTTCKFTPNVHTKSIGHVNNGRLQPGVESTTRSFARSASRVGLQYGTLELIHMLEAASCAMNERYGTQIEVGDISLPNGGPMPKHSTHQSGRDADIGVMYRRSNGKISNNLLKVACPKLTTCTGPPTEQFTSALAENWALIKELEHRFPMKSLLLDKYMIFELHKHICKVEPNHPLVDKLFGRNGCNNIPSSVGKCTYVRKESDPECSWQGKLRHVDGHADHYHITIMCPKNDKPDCLDAAAPVDGVNRGGISGSTGTSPGVPVSGNSFVFSINDPTCQAPVPPTSREVYVMMPQTVSTNPQVYFYFRGLRDSSNPESLVDYAKRVGVAPWDSNTVIVLLQEPEAHYQNFVKPSGTTIDLKQWMAKESYNHCFYPKVFDEIKKRTGIEIDRVSLMAHSAGGYAVANLAAKGVAGPKVENGGKKFRDIVIFDGCYAGSPTGNCQRIANVLAPPDPRAIVQGNVYLYYTKRGEWARGNEAEFRKTVLRNVEETLAIGAPKIIPKLLSATDAKTQHTPMVRNCISDHKIQMTSCVRAS